MNIPDALASPPGPTQEPNDPSPGLAATVCAPFKADIPVARARDWVPIRSLGPRHRGRIVAHLHSLEVSDRYLRFGYPASDAQISKYVDTLDFEKDEVFGIFNRRLELLAVAHLAHIGIANHGGGTAMSEFGVSVLPRGRRRGFGRRLFENAALHARNRGIDTLFIQALSENTAMLRIARNAGATVVREGSESDARLRLAPDTLASHVGEIVGRGAAELDYRLKARAYSASHHYDSSADVGDLPSDVSCVASE